MSDTIRVLRISEPGRLRGGASAVHVVDSMLQQLGVDRTLYSRWCSLPTPGDDRHIVLGHPLNIRDTEVCGVVDERQLRLWWPEWSINALGAHESEHDVHLDVYEVEPDHLRVGMYQTVFNPDHATKVASIPLASSGLTFNDVVAYLGDQNAHAVARGDRYATLYLNA